MKLTTDTPITLRLPDFARVHLVLVGAGGTGSHIATGLAALSLELTARGTACTVDIVDPDKVERKNIGRQLFCAADLGKFKAVVLAERLRGAYRLPAAEIPAPFSAPMVAPAARTLTVIVGAVDNPAARAEMAAAVERGAGSVWWLDAGNENHSGQVALGNALQVAPALGFVDSLPAPHVVYPDLVAAPKAKKRAASCADATAEGTQGLMVNRMAAAWALALLHDFLLDTVRYFAVDFDLRHAGVRSRALTTNELAPWTKARR